MGQGDEIIQNKDLKLQKEDRLLLLCSRTKVDDLTSKKIESLINPELDWDHLVEMANRHRLMPLLYVNLNSICPEKVPEEVLENLKEEFHENARKNLLLTGELVKVMKLLENNGINAIPFKGPVLAYSIYDNIAYRQFSDIDILINKEGALNVKKIVQSLGYELKPDIIVKDSIYMKLFSEYTFVNRNNNLIMELNWNFEGISFSFHSNPNFLFNDLEKVEINDYKFKSFQSINQFLMLCIHASKHFWMRLSWICDIHEFLQNKNINWDEILEKSEILGVKRIVLINIILAKELFGLDIPSQILYLLPHDLKIMSITQNIKKMIFIEQKQSLTIFEKFIFIYSKRENSNDGFKDCVKGLTKPDYRDFLDIPLKENLFFLYGLIRPFLLLKRYININNKSTDNL